MIGSDFLDIIKNEHGVDKKHCFQIIEERHKNTKVEKLKDLIDILFAQRIEYPSDGMKRIYVRKKQNKPNLKKKQIKTNLQFGRYRKSRRN